MRKKLTAGFLLVLAFLLLPQSVLALKARSSRGSSGSRVYSTAGRVGSSVKFNGGRNGLVIYFSGLTNAKSVTYTLSYESNGISQGAMGTISNITTATDSRELLFGTCSGGVCRYHQNISNAKLVITSKLKSGLTTRKTYRIRI
jgi:hypothetical protein